MPYSVAVTTAVPNGDGRRAPDHVDALAAGAEDAGRHRLIGDEQVVQPRGRAEAHLVGGVEHALLVAQQALGVVERHRLGEALGREAAPAAEEIGQLALGHAEGAGEARQIGLVGAVLR